MPETGERAYAYTKACGIIGKSFVGKRIAGLAHISRLAELDRLVFPPGKQDLPERELLVDLEDRIIYRAVKQIITIADSFTNPPALFLRLIRTYEYEDLKTMLGALAQGETKNPGFTDIGRFRTVDFEAFPNLSAMLGGTEFKFLLQEDLHPDITHQDSEGKKNGGDIMIQTKLDQHYYNSLWEDMTALQKSDRTAIERILSEEISLRNAVLALRLRIYYGMSDDAIREKFISVKSNTRKKFFAAAAAEESLALPLDQRSEWSKWKWSKFLNPENPQEHWKADPRYFQNAASEYLYHLARFSFRRKPLSLDSIFCFIKLKQFEEDLLISAAEGLAMGISIQDIFTLLEVET